MTQKKHTLKHPKTGEVRETTDAGTALQLKAHHGYKDVKKDDEKKDAPKAQTPAKTGEKS
jgi:hypothetical protein